MSRRGIGSALILGVCFLVLGAAGCIAVFAFNQVGAAGAPQVTTATVRVDSNEAGGLAQLTTVGAIRLNSGRTLAAGTVVNTTSDQLAAASSAAPAVGGQLSCALRVGWADGSNVIDVVHCTPSDDSGS
ncbi:MAG TPA: hypothetical protein VG756_09650 [Pseudonocardiaceae bacterium]|jgi:hypothetical protein|nr:hypothetical protein [Pseudonocardiaceae bacterium]